MNQSSDKVCQVCFLPFSYRKKWEKNWNEVQICSEKCRKNKRPKVREKIRLAVLKTCEKRYPNTICPSEVARDLFDDWRPMMETVREVARALHTSGKIAILQKGIPVKDLRFRGPIRLKLTSP